MNHKKNILLNRENLLLNKTASKTAKQCHSIQECGATETL
jgi:hypothetical protein